MILPKIPSAFTKLFSGKFSYAFQSRVTNSLTNVKNCNYLNPCSKLTALNHYAVILPNQQKSLQKFKSTSEISFGNHEFGQSFTKIRKKNNRFHCYDIEKYGDHYWQRIGFKERIFNYGVTRIFHFLDDKFFFGELFFKDNQKIDVDAIKKTLLTKYLTDMPDAFESNFRIDFADGLIYFEDTGINLSIKYIQTKEAKIIQILKEITAAKSISISENLQQNDLHDVF